MTNKIACIEAGGTKFVCAIGDIDGTIIDRVSIPTTTPEQTMALVVEYFNKFKDQFSQLSIGTFGPAEINRNAENFGSITTTPKPGWANFNMLKYMQQHFDFTDVYFDTDVNAAAAGELRWGAAQGLSSCLYITVGTGIGAGAVVNNKLLQGLSHPEMGHILVRRHVDDDFSGVCPYHGDCLEGMASGPAIEKRWGVKGTELPIDHQSWQFSAYYLAQALMNYILILSPEKIIMGGGVMKQEQMFPLIHSEVQKLLNNYIDLPPITKNIEQYIVPPKLGDNAGISGTIAMTLMD